MIGQQHTTTSIVDQCLRKPLSTRDGQKMSRQCWTPLWIGI